ncbi:MAG TPA: chaperone modulator CbpM [Chitinophagales bacterium]|nr:chaperone modulator CbpM [Chitinophagales bacterium]
MKQPQLIPTKTLCSLYNIEISFVDALNQMGLIQIQIIEQKKFIHHDELSNLEKILRLHNDLHLNLESIDVVFNLLEKERELRNEVNTLRNRLRLYE